MKKEEMLKKLVAVKNLAEQGVGGEKETAKRMYEALKLKYGISEAEIEAAVVPDVEEKNADNVFTLWVLTTNLKEERELCEGCQEDCQECGTYENIKKLEKEYEKLATR